MNRIGFQVALLSLTMFAAVVHAQTAKEYPVLRALPGSVLSAGAEGKEAKPEEAPKDLAELLPGKWQIEPNKRAASGWIVFNKNGTYEMHEKLKDGTGVGRKGQYKLDIKATPATLDLYLGKAGAPGSEWTALFGIVRALSDKKLEFYSSSDGKRPKAFPEGKTAEGMMILVRAD